MLAAPRDPPRRARVGLLARLALPAMLAEMSSVVMQYVDASMVGSLGKDPAAAIGLVAAVTWLFGSVCHAASVGFTVQVAQLLGAGRDREARGALRQGFACTLGLGLAFAAAGAAIAAPLPGWLGGGQEIAGDASRYFLVVLLSLPLLQLDFLAAGALEASGDMKTPSFLNIQMCVLDVLFNALLIFPPRAVSAAGLRFTLPGADLGVLGAALGTAAAEAVTAVLMVAALALRAPRLGLRAGGAAPFTRSVLRKAARIAAPVAAEGGALCGAMVAATAIIAPLGTVAIAANSLAITAESLCYMPGYGIGTAATTLVGQSVGAGRFALARSFGRLGTALGAAVMAAAGALLFAFAPGTMAMLTPDAAVRAAGAAVLRIEAFAEPFFGASIVAGRALRGAGDTLVPGALTIGSMWLVRIPLAAVLAPRLGLRGAWIAMAAELTVRGLLQLARLLSSPFLRPVGAGPSPTPGKRP